MPKLGINMPKMGMKKSSNNLRHEEEGATKAVEDYTSLADALFTTTQQRVLSLLFGQPGRSFYANDLIERTGSGSGAVQRELKRLASSGLVTVKAIGNQRHYQANPDSPVYDDLCGLVKKTVGLVEPLKQSLSPIAKKIHLSVLYGSVAKGTDTADSDIDVLIVADGVMLEEVYSVLAPAENALGRKISPTLYTRQEYEKRLSSNNPFLTKVLSGKYIVLMDNRDEPSATG